MTITSISFLLFLLVVFCLFYLCPVKGRWIILLISSIAFYVLAGAWNFLPFILLTSLAVWFCAGRIGELYEEQERELEEAGADRAAKKTIRASYRKKAKRFLLAALLLSVGVLLVTKFAHTVADLFSRLLSGGQGGAALILVPLGISYYTFSVVGYLLDVYWKRYPCEKNFARFFLYAIYFPHIVQGPISRYNLLGSELKKELRFDSRRILYGLERMLWGFFKKMVLADRLELFVSSVFDGGDHAGSIFLIAALFDAVQIYTDFSGYMDIVRGASEIFGVQLESNFQHPFFSESVPEFWRRWHITLGAWFKDYVYYPISVSRWMKKLNKFAKTHLPQFLCRVLVIGIPMMIVWILTGLWHGTGVNYLCWGVYYGILITASSVLAPEFEKADKALHIRTDSFLWRLFRKVRTFCCFVGGRLLTSPGSLHYCMLVVKTIFLGFAPRALINGTLLSCGLNLPNLLLVLFGILLLWAVSMMQERFSLREKLSALHPVLRWAVLFAGIFSILIFGIYGLGYEETTFIYEAF